MLAEAAASQAAEQLIRAARPDAMLIAPFTSASIGPHVGQITVSWRGRAHRAPQRWQVMLSTGSMA